MSDRKKMPEPVDVWLYGNGTPGEWSATSVMFPNPYTRIAINGPYKIVPGVMSLDELAEHNDYIGHDVHSDLWYTYRPGQRIKHANYKTALEAQWAATCLARKNVDHAETKE